MSNRFTFPEGFLWGAATASYQVEGGIENCDWAQAAREGKVPECGRACDHYNRYEEDFDIAKSLGHNAHRFSVEWARIEPEEGKFDEAAIEHYRLVLQSLREREIQPYITLWHFTLPQWFADSGGFERKDAPRIFARYCAHVVSKLEDLCGDYSTMNEPNVYASHGYLFGAWPPFRRGSILGFKLSKEEDASRKTQSKPRFSSILAYLRVINLLAVAHNQAYDAIKLVSPSASVSVVKHVRYFYANANPFNKLLAYIATYFQSGRFLNKVVDKTDVIGLNYYRSTKFGGQAQYDLNDMGWRVTPWDIEHALVWLHRYRKPIIVTEAGVADAADTIRSDYIRKQVNGVARAIQRGVDVRGHMYWSFLDNYEWAAGLSIRFGLIEVNYDTLERTVRPSAYMYKEICETGSIEV